MTPEGGTGGGKVYTGKRDAPPEAEFGEESLEPLSECPCSRGNCASVLTPFCSGLGDVPEEMDAWGELDVDTVGSSALGDVDNDARRRGDNASAATATASRDRLCA